MQFGMDGGRLPPSGGPAGHPSAHSPAHDPDAPMTIDALNPVCCATLGLEAPSFPRKRESGDCIEVDCRTRSREHMLPWSLPPARAGGGEFEFDRSALRSSRKGPNDTESNLKPEEESDGRQA